MLLSKDFNALIRLALALTSLAASSACNLPQQETESDSAQLVGERCAGSTTNRDDDRDGIDDGQEQCVLEENAPVMRLTAEKLRPTNVDWFMARSELRFDHGAGCGDCGLINAPDQQSMSAVRHSSKNRLADYPWESCDHNGDSQRVEVGVDVLRVFDHGSLSFYLNVNDGARSGSSNPSDWKVYGHVYPNDIRGVNAQYWFFYAYSAGTAAFGEHEGDWEMVTVVRSADGTVDSVLTCAHGECSSNHPSALQWTSSTHPHVYVASGTHASYPSVSACNRGEKVAGYCLPHNALWYTWPGAAPGDAFQGAGIVNLGERGLPLNGQRFVNAMVMWGEHGVGSLIDNVGLHDYSSGPSGPAFGGKWNLRQRPYSNADHVINNDPNPPVAPETCAGITCRPDQYMNDACACLCRNEATCGDGQRWDHGSCSCVSDPGAAPFEPGR